MKMEVEVAGKTRTVEYVPGAPEARIDDESVAVNACLLRRGVLSLEIAGRTWRAVLEDGAAESAILLNNVRYPYRIHDPRSLKHHRARSGGADGPKVLKASMPGRVIRVLVSKDEAVESGQGVVVIEAMKMQNELKSPKAGKVAELRVTPGDTVSAGDVLAVIE